MAFEVSHGQGAAYDQCWQGLLHHDTHGRLYHLSISLTNYDVIDFFDRPLII